GTVVVGVVAYVAAGVAVRVDAQRPVTAARVVHLADDGGPARRLDGWRQSPDPDPGGTRRRAADRVPASYPGVRARVYIVPGRGRVPPAVEPDLLRTVGRVVRLGPQQRAAPQPCDDNLVCRRGAQVHPEQLARLDTDRVEVTG